MVFRRSLQTKTVTCQALENQQVYIWQKICLRYFELSQTYFRLSPLYFQFTAGSFLPRKKNIFLRRKQILSKTFHGRFCTGPFLLHTRLMPLTATKAENIYYFNVFGSKKRFPRPLRNAGILIYIVRGNYLTRIFFLPTM